MNKAYSDPWIRCTRSCIVQLRNGSRSKILPWIKYVISYTEQLFTNVQTFYAKNFVCFWWFCDWISKTLVVQMYESHKHPRLISLGQLILHYWIHTFINISHMNMTFESFIHYFLYIIWLSSHFPFSPLDVSTTTSTSSKTSFRR